MKRILSLFSIVFALCLTAKAQPRIVFSREQIDLGKLIWHNAKEANFTLTNKGNAPLILKAVETGCGCTAAQWDDKPIAPDSSTTIRVRYDAELLGHFTRDIEIYTNERTAPFLLSIFGVVRMEDVDDVSNFAYRDGNLCFNADEIEFDDVNRGDQPEAVVRIFNAGTKSMRPTVMHLPKYLSATVVPTSIHPNRAGKIIFRLNSNLLHNMGLTQTAVYLSAYPGDRIRKTNEINVSTTLLPKVDATKKGGNQPQAVLDSTMVNLTMQGKKKVTTELWLTNKGTAPLLIQALQVYNPGISVRINHRKIPAGAQERMRITISATAQTVKGRHRILLITNDPKQPKMVIDINVKK